MWLVASSLALGLLSSPPVATPPDARADARPTKTRRARKNRPPPKVPNLGYRHAVDLPILFVAGATWITTEALRSEIAPTQCKWCNVNQVDEATREALRFADAEAAADTSDVLAYGLVPATFLALELAAVAKAGAFRVLHEDLIIVFESIAVSAAITQGIKFGTGRQRPYAHFAATPIPFAEDPDQNLSFVSGHTALAFSTVVAGGTVTTMRGYELAPVVWAVGVPMATFTGYLRIAGDRHYLSDVLVGAAVGATAGFVLPFALHHPRFGLLTRRDRRRAFEIALWPTPRGFRVSGRF
jgi:membrane-associated phospholipid phosphatase